MKSALSIRSNAAWKPLALASAMASIAMPVSAQVESVQKLPTVTVSESRFANSTPSPIGATVITAEQIREAGIGNVNEAIRKIGGVYGRQSLMGTSDFSLDLRGFGENSDRNIVILVDGIRISENEGANALMSAIAIDSVERIEIVRGGSSVLYGEGATGGTIQIITKRGKAGVSSASLFAETGNYGHNEARASLSKSWDAFTLDANLGSARADNYRANNELRQDTFSGGLQWADNDARLGVRIESSRQDNRFPGALTLAQFQRDPRQTFTPDEFGSFDMDRYTFFAEKRLGNLELALDYSHRIKNSEFYQYGSFSHYRSEMTQLSPRLRYSSKGSAYLNEFVAGVDLGHSNRVRNASYANDDATQRSDAIYFRNELTAGDARLAVGARHEKFKKNTSDLVLMSSNYQNEASVNAWTLEGSYAVKPLLNVFAKAGRSYRVANVDDNAGKTSIALLKPQTSDDLEFGASLGDDNRKLTAKVFQHKLKNEIFYDPTVGLFGANVNLDPTKREGIELEARARLSSAFVLTTMVQHVSAKFTEGPHAGLEMTLVPKNTASMRLNWLPGNGHSADVGVQWVAAQRFGGDFSNACTARMPAFTTLDARYAIRAGTWEFAISGANLTDRNYYTQAFGACASSAQVYPESGRVLKLSVRKDF